MAAHVAVCEEQNVISDVYFSVNFLEQISHIPIEYCGDLTLEKRSLYLHM